MSPSYPAGQQAETNRKEPQVLSQLKYLDHTIERLGEIVSELQLALEPVSRGPEPQPPVAVAEKNPTPLVQLAKNIAASTERVNMLNEQLVSLHRRLEI
jgi:hypothetical protein